MTTLVVTPKYDAPPLEVTMPSFELVGTIYRAICDFSNSPKYIPKQWEGNEEALKGFQWLKMRSALLEKYLEAEFTPSHLLWTKWLR